MLQRGLSAGEIAGGAARALQDYQLRPPGWTPHPHQVPPPGDWYGWLLNAGRGAGKTDACSHYIIDHVKGPPCLNGPVPHWIGIIAPTLGDAVTACANGPSGIIPNDPTAKLSGGVGGTLIRWDNGSQAKLFGASGPEDVERLRAGGNTCLTENTLVRTEYGEVPIKSIRAGDMVWTRNGLRRVLRAGQTGIHPTLLVTFETGRTLQLTGNHEVWVDGEWREARFLKPDDTLTAWRTTSNMMVSDGIDEKMGITRTQVEDVDYCIGLSGSSITEQSHVAMTYIISLMMTEEQPTSLDLKYSHIVNTRVNTQDVITPVTHALGKRRGKIDLSMMFHADVAVNSFGHVPPQNHGIALTATSSGMIMVRSQVGHTHDGCALCAEMSSQPPSVDSPVLAHDRVLHVSRQTHAVPVYDLLVEHDHEFFANGVLVANCCVWLEELAAWRYLEACYQQMRFGLRTGPRPRWVASTTPKPKPLIKKLVKNTPKNVVVTHATTDDNPFLQAEVRAALEEDYGGQQIGRQELHAEIMEQDESALWRRDDLDEFRVKESPELARVTVGVDPSGGAGEQGIVVAGKHVYTEIVNDRLQKRFEGYVLDDRTCCLSPAGWGKRAVQAAIDWEADDIVVETNYGGEMAVVTIRDAAEAMGITIPVKTVVATRGKRVRAEPVSALSTRGQWHHVGTFEALEDQLCVTAGTQILTQRGYVQITDIIPGDYVQTRDGLAPIAWCGVTGTTTQLTQVHVHDSILSCTPNHPVLLSRQDKFVPALSVQNSHHLLVDHNWGKTAGRSNGVVAGGVGRHVEITDTLRGDYYTVPSGKSIMDPSQMDTSFITSISHRVTINSKISNLSHISNILKSTAERQRFIDELSSRGLRIDDRSVEMNGLDVSHVTSRALTAVTSFSQLALRQHTAHRVVVEQLKSAVSVYNLTVAPNHLPEYFANGVLVHNCTWTPELGYSPDRLDAMVWTAWHNKIVATRPRGVGSFASGTVMSQRIG